MHKLKYNLLFIIIITFVSSFQILSQEYLLGNWGGNRSTLSEKGYNFEFVTTGEFWGALGSDLEKKTTYLDNIDITATFELEKIFGWNGATLFAYILGNNGGIPNDRVGTAGRYGSIQGISNIATHSTWKLYQFWLEQQLFDNRLAVLFGLYDLNSEFDVQETSGIFINPSHGIGAEYAQSGENGPSIFSTTSLAVRFKYKPSENLYAMLGVFDGVPGDPNNPNGTQIVFGEKDGLLIAYELGLFENGKVFEAGFGKYSVGGWYYTSEFEDLTEVDGAGKPLMLQSNFGLYLSAEKFLFPEVSDSSQGLAAFLRFGIANSDINPLNYYWGAGINVTGLISSRDEDILGIAIGVAHAGEKFMSLNKAEGLMINENEIILELTYSLQATPWLRIQPDFQYVHNPMGTFASKKANVLGVRVEVVL